MLDWVPIIFIMFFTILLGVSFFVLSALHDFIETKFCAQKNKKDSQTITTPTTTQRTETNMIQKTDSSNDSNSKNLHNTGTLYLVHYFDNKADMDDYIYVFVPFFIGDRGFALSRYISDYIYPYDTTHSAIFVIDADKIMDTSRERLQTACFKFLDISTH